MTQIVRRLIYFIICTCLIAVIVSVTHTFTSNASLNYGTILFIPLYYSPEKQLGIEQKIQSLNNLLAKQSNKKQLVIFADASSLTTEEEAKNFISLLTTINSNPVIVYGDTLSSFVETFALDSTPSYGMYSIVKTSRSKIDMIKIDTRKLYSDLIIQTAGQPDSLSAPTDIYRFEGDTQTQYDWLSALTAQPNTSTIIVTQRNLNLVDDVYRKAITNVLCASKMPVFVSFSEQNTITNQVPCPGRSFNLLQLKTNDIMILGLEKTNLYENYLHIYTVDLGQKNLTIEDSFDAVL